MEFVVSPYSRGQRSEVRGQEKEMFGKRWVGLRVESPDTGVAEGPLQQAGPRGGGVEAAKIDAPGRTPGAFDRFRLQVPTTPASCKSVP